MKKAKTTCVGIQHIKCAVIIVSLVWQHHCRLYVGHRIFCASWGFSCEVSSSSANLPSLQRHSSRS